MFLIQPWKVPNIVRILISFNFHPVYHGSIHNSFPMFHFFGPCSIVLIMVFPLPSDILCDFLSCFCQRDFRSTYAFEYTAAIRQFLRKEGWLFPLTGNPLHFFCSIIPIPPYSDQMYQICIMYFVCPSQLSHTRLMNQTECPLHLLAVFRLKLLLWELLRVLHWWSSGVLIIFSIHLSSFLIPTPTLPLFDPSV